MISWKRVYLVLGREKELQQDKEQAQAIYKHVEGEVRSGLEYLQVEILFTPTP